MARGTLVHQALLYDSPGHFVETMSQFVRDGLERGETVFAATKPANIDALRQELGDEAGLLELQNTAEWCTHPYERLQTFRQMVDHVPPGGLLRAMGEPVWTGSDAVVRQWARYESLINLALAEASMRFICLYDSSALPDRILDYAVRTHPEQIDGHRTAACPDFVPPYEFLPGPAAAPPATTLELPLHEGSELRRQVTELALDAGLEPRRAEAFMLAVHEVVTNAVVYGKPPARAHAWAEGDELVCRVVDSGPGISDPLAGWIPPSEPVVGGWGLPIARQLCDAVEILRSESENVVSLHLSIGDPGRRDGH